MKWQAKTMNHVLIDYHTLYFLCIIYSLIYLMTHYVIMVIILNKNSMDPIKAHISLQLSVDIVFF